MKRTLVAVAAVMLITVTTQAADRRPNIILLLADDLGWTGIGCFGSDSHETPNVDRLAAEGMTFTNAYSACTVCSPTRASLIVGKYRGMPRRMSANGTSSPQRRPPITRPTRSSRPATALTFPSASHQARAAISCPKTSDVPTVAEADT